MKKMYKRGKRILVMVLVFAILCTSLPCTPTIPVHAALVEKNGTWYEVDSRINASWGGHIAGEITVTNVSSQTRRDWQIVFPWQAKISSMWNGSYEETEKGYLITPMEYNRELAPEASVSVGFLAEGEDSELNRLTEEVFFQEEGASITDAEDRENMTPAPSVDVTVSPSGKPTAGPSVEPVVSPTIEPAIIPTPELTVSPTVEPIVSPTIEPAIIPTPELTVSPTVKPTTSPTIEPAIISTPELTVSPTVKPTVSPTVKPTVSPTVEPTASPTAEPTASPTVEATASPTAGPTVSPTVEATASPTAEPTVSPTVEATASPTIEPTATPTIKPTEEPAEDLYIYTDTTISGDLVCGNLFLMGGSLECSGHSITVRKDYFQNDGICSLQDTELIISGGARMAAGEMEISRSDIHIGDDFVIDSGKAVSFVDCSISVAGDFDCHLTVTRRLNQEQGSMEIGGNLTVSGGSYNLYDSAKVKAGGDVRLTGNGVMCPGATGGTMEIGGDLLINSSGWSKFYKGQIFLHGDLIQTKKAAKKGFQIQDGFILKFCGDRKQKIELAYPDTTTLGTMDFRETPGMETPDVLCGEQVYDFSKIGKKKSLLLNLDHVELVQDEVIDCENLEWNIGTFRGGKYDFSVTGDLSLHGGKRFAMSTGNLVVKNFTIDGTETVFLPEGSVTVDGDFDCATGDYLGQYAGNMEIRGDLVIRSGGFYSYEEKETKVAGSVRLEGEGYLSLDDCRMEIGGDFLIRSAGESFLNAKQIRLHGNLIQTEEAAWNSLTIKKKCCIVFCGNSMQKIEIACYPYNAEMGTLDFREAVGVEIPDELDGCRIYDFPKIGKKKSLLLVRCDLETVKDEEVDCENLVLEGSSLSVKEHDFIVKGSLTMKKGGKLFCQEGKLKADNLILDKISSAYLREGTLLDIPGDFHCATLKDFDVTQMKMQIGGDLVVSQGGICGNLRAGSRVRGDVRIEGQGSLQLDADSWEMRLEIAGDLRISSRKQSRINSGKMTLYGDLIQSETASSDSLAVGDDCILKFCGSGRQKIKLAYPETTTLGTMDFRETPGMEVPDILRGKRVIDFKKIGKKQNLRLELSDMTLEQDEIIDCRDVEWIGVSLNVRGYVLHVKGNLTVRDSKGISIYYGTLIADGNMAVYGRGQIWLNYGTIKTEKNLLVQDGQGIQQYYGGLVVKGDLDVQNCGSFRLSEASLAVDNLSVSQVGDVLFCNDTITVGGDLFCAVDSRLYTTGKMDVGGSMTVRQGAFQQEYCSSTEIKGDLRIVERGKLEIDSRSGPFVTLNDLRINGDLLFDSAEQSVLQNGQITLGGNITQIEDEEIDNLIIADSGFNLELCGTLEQTVDLPGIYEGFSLDLTNSKAVCLKQDFSGYRLVGAEKIIPEGEDLYLDYRTVELTGDMKIPGNLYCYGNFYDNGNVLKVDGNCIQTGDVWVQNGGKLEIAGDYIAKAGMLYIDNGSVHVKGNVRIKKDAAIIMQQMESYLLIDGDYINGSRMSVSGASNWDATLELKGDLIQRDSASSAGINLWNIHLVFSGDKVQKVQMPKNAIFGNVKWLDLQNAAGVNFTGNTVKANQITGFSNLQINGEICLYKSRITLTQDEEFSGDITMSDTCLDCNGYEFRLSGGGSLEQWDGLVNLDHGTLYVDGDYILHCNSILQMIQEDDLLRVKGSFETQSFMNHSSMLRNGRMELWGNFNQGGDRTSFASSGNFVIAFMGSGQRAYFDDNKDSGFANIDSAHDGVRIVDYPMILEDSMSFRICRGILTGLQDALGIRELNGAAAAIIAALGISLAASSVIMPAMVVSIVGMIMGVVGAVSSAFMAITATGGIYSTAMGAGSKYDKAEDFAHDATMLAVSLVNVWGSVTMIRNNLALFKSASQNLAGRTTRPTVSEVVNSSKGAGMISNLDDFLDYTKGFLDEDALQYVKGVLGNDADDIAKLKKVARLIEDGSGKIGRKLSKGELKAGLDALWDDAGVEGALAAIESWSKGGGATIAKETNLFIDYVNRAGKKIRIPKQSGKNIDKSIASKLNSTTDGERIEAKVAHFIKNDMGKELTDFGNKVKYSTGQTIGDIDCGMEDVLIEVKKSVGSVDVEQFYKYVNCNNEEYINMSNKKVVLYIDEAMENLSVMNQEKLQSIEKMGVIIVNGLDELKGVLK